MALSKALLKKIRLRDQYCWHCGNDDDTLVPHHRMNRGMGGSKKRENDIRNVILVCAFWNGEMESSAGAARRARNLGHKLSAAGDVSTPLFDMFAQQWFVLNEDGTKETVL